MKKKDKDIIYQAKKAATDYFNSLPFEIRKKLANGENRLHEIEILLSKGDRLSLADVKKRKRELENWLLEWYKENY